MTAVLLGGAQGTRLTVRPRRLASSPRRNGEYARACQAGAGGTRPRVTITERPATTAAANERWLLAILLVLAALAVTSVVVIGVRWLQVTDPGAATAHPSEAPAVIRTR